MTEQAQMQAAKDKIIKEARTLGVSRPWEGSTDRTAHAQDSIVNLAVKSFDIGICAAREWVYCKDRIPEGEGACLGTGKDGKVKLAYYKDGKMYPALSDAETIIAWQELPPPAKMEE